MAVVVHARAWHLPVLPIESYCSYRRTANGGGGVRSCNIHRYLGLDISHSRAISRLGYRMCNDGGGAYALYGVLGLEGGIDTMAANPICGCASLRFDDGGGLAGSRM